MLVGINAGLGAMFATTRSGGAVLAIAPAIAAVLASLIASNRAILVFAAFAMNLFAPLVYTGALPLSAYVGLQVYPADVLVLLAVGSWLAAWLVGPESRRPRSLRTPVLGWPLLLFALALFAAVIRGHERYGEQIIGVPARLVVYAGIAWAVTDLTARDVYRWLVVLFYAGAVWQSAVAIWGYATGTSVTDQVLLSTGGQRVLAGSTAMFMTGALLLALLNLEFGRLARATALHLIVAALASFALVSTFQRTTFVAASVLVPLFLLVFRRSGLRAAALLPLCAPFVGLVVLLVPRADPSFFPTFAGRVSASPSTDVTAQWRLRAYEAVWQQVRDSPVVGVGFGQPVRFISNGVHYTVDQDPHNQFLFLWAGGGTLLFGSFVLLLLVYLLESWRRYKIGTTEERRLIFWAVSLWFVFVVNSGTGIILTQPHLLIVFWTLMVLPMIVRPRGRDAVSRA